MQSVGYFKLIRHRNQSNRSHSRWISHKPVGVQVLCWIDASYIIPSQRMNLRMRQQLSIQTFHFIHSGDHSLTPWFIKNSYNDDDDDDNLAQNIECNSISNSNKPHRSKETHTKMMHSLQERADGDLVDSGVCGFLQLTKHSNGVCSSTGYGDNWLWSSRQSIHPLRCQCIHKRPARKLAMRACSPTPHLLIPHPPPALPSLLPSQSPITTPNRPKLPHQIFEWIFSTLNAFNPHQPDCFSAEYSLSFGLNWAILPCGV